VSESGDSERVASDQRTNGFPKIRTVASTAPFRWLALGWSDYRNCVPPAAFYGLCFALMGYVLHFVFERAYEYTTAMATGFLLVGPFLCIGLYELSRRRELGMPCALAPTLAVWRGNAGNIGIYCLVIGVVFLVWARASLVLFALFYDSQMPTLRGFLAQIFRPENLQFLAVYFGVGLIFATLVFAASVISIPLMLDRNQDAITAMLSSFIALGRNAAALTLWAALIAGLTAIGFATLYLGLIVCMPVIGHATWHAYRELVEPA
jgi:uncharacterized membrane protein